MKKILILDDHEITRKGVSICCKRAFGNLVEIKEVSNPGEMLSSLKQNNDFSLCIMDLFIDDKSTIPNLSTIKSLYPKIPILVLSIGRENIFGMRVLREGANGYINKTANEDELIKAIKTVGENDYYFSNELMKKSALTLAGKDFMNLNPITTLTNQEFNILLLLLKGCTTSEISQQLLLKSTTVSTFKSRIYEKLGTSRINEIIKIANDSGIEYL